MIVLTEISACRATLNAIRHQGGTVGLVPTMGALHAGHRSLMEAAKARATCSAVTIFVNPTQFSAGEDFSTYPKPLDADLQICRAAGVNVVFAPNNESMYSRQARTSIHVSGLTEGLCGPFRPGHFDGVATVVAKLFHILPSDFAFFGEKDYQQLVVIRRMVADLDIPIEIVACPTVREADGLAMSSRNVYLSAGERIQAASLNRALFAAAERIRVGELAASKILEGIRQEIFSTGPCQIEYVDVVDDQTLEPLAEVNRRARICLAVRIGACRLIDNVGVDAASSKR